VLHGASLNEIANRWNELGVLTPQRSKHWNGTVVKATLTGPRHAGLRVHRGEVIGPAAWPALIDRQTHDRLVAYLNRHQPRRPPRRTPFTGLIRDTNGVPLDRDVVRGRASYRGHRRAGRPDAQPISIAAEALEALILEMLFTAVENDKLGERLGTQRRRRSAAPDIGAIEGDLLGLAEDHGAGRISRGEWLAARGPLEQRLQAAQAAVAEGAAAEEVVRVDVDLREVWPTLHVDRQRATLAAVFDRIEIRPSARRGGPAPMVDDVGRIDIGRVSVVWRA
jgi:site-specific DNA recombinase